MIYNTPNVAFTEVDGPENSKLMATVLFPKDAKRRLEVWWLNEAARSGTYLIIINGQSTWSAPKGLKLGLQVAALEKLNGKPFKLKGFDKDNSSTITNWDGGVLGQLPGGCKAGVRLTSDAKAAAGGTPGGGRHRGLRFDRRQSAGGEARRRRDHPGILGRAAGIS